MTARSDKGHRRFGGPVRRLALALVGAVALFSVSLLAESVCEGCACDCEGSIACGGCVNTVINTCCSGPQPAGCCSVSCQGGTEWEVTCEEGGDPFICNVDLGEPCIE